MFRSKSEKRATARLDRDDLLEPLGQAGREQADAGIKVNRDIPFRAGLGALDHAIGQESIHLKERIAADLESGILDRATDADRLQRLKRRARHAVQNINLHLRFVSKELDRGRCLHA